MTAVHPAAPQLSIIAASRNDDHGGRILHRMRLFVQGLIDQTRRHCLPVELILVDWNPPPDRPPLSDVLPRPLEHDWLTLRCITVPPSVHQRYRRAAEIPLFQMIAKNVGIRRARSEYILCTNIDLLFSDALMARLATTRLRTTTYYRANRCDVPDEIDPAWNIAGQLAWCERHVMRRLGRDARYKNINLELAGLTTHSAFKKWVFDKQAIALRLFWSREKQLFYQLDTFACGDFTLMSRDAWLAIQGYLELDLYSLHVDSLALIAAAALGYKQHVFPRHACTYHLDHPSGWESLSPLAKVRFLEQRPAIDYSLVHEAGLYALQERKAFNLNDPNWGYADLDFPECTFAPAGADVPGRAAGLVNAGV